MWAGPEDQKKIGNRLAVLRRAAGMTQKDLAASLGKPQSFVSSVENGQRRLDLLEYLNVTEALQADPIRVFREIISEVRSKDTGQ